LDCHICEKKSKIFINEKTKINYYDCQDCEYIFKSAENYQDFKTQKKRYDLHQNKDSDKQYEAYFQHFLDFVLPKISKAKTVLDFGCGASTLLAQMLEKKGFKSTYFDPIYYPEISLDEKKYDLIVSVEVFEHLSQPKETFAYLIEKLNTGGHLAIQTEFHPNNKEAFMSWYYPQDPTHIVFFRKKTFEVLAKDFSCNIVADNGKNMIIIAKL